MENKEVVEIIKSWITDHVRPQKTIRRRGGAYSMKGLVERDLGLYITEAQFVKAMTDLGYKQEDGDFNSILISKLKPELDKTIATTWGLTKLSHAMWKRAQKSLEP